MIGLAKRERVQERNNKGESGGENRRGGKY